jgi:nucleoside-diphosphate-sugar epimerase
MNILVIGGTRFIGPGVVERLVNLGHDVVLFHRGAPDGNANGNPTGVKHIQGDRHQLEASRDALRALAPELVLDMIPITEANAESVVNMFTGIARRTVAISSQDVYRAYGKLIGIESCDVQPTPLTETSAVRENIYPYREGLDKDHILYNYDKILVERTYLGAADLPGTILRLPMVYGPGDYQHRLHPYLKRMNDKRSAIILEEGIASWRWSKGFVADMSEAIVLAVTNEAAAGQIYNVNETESLSEAEWVAGIGKAVGWSGEIVTAAKDKVPEHLNPGMDTSQELVSDSAKIRSELGFGETVTPDEALKLTIDWEQNNPPEQIDENSFNYAREDAFLSKR